MMRTHGNVCKFTHFLTSRHGRFTARGKSPLYYFDISWVSTLFKKIVPFC